MTMNFEEWELMFKPIKNYIEEDSALDGCMFETYGKELDFVRNHSFYNVWTLVEGDKGLYIIEGYHVVNRMGYLITSNPWTEGVNYEVRLD